MVSSHDLTVLLNTDVNTAPARRSLAEFQKQVERTTRINIDGREVFQSLIRYTNEAGQGFRTFREQVLDANGTLQTTREIVSDVSQRVTTLETSTTRWRTAAGRTITHINKLNSEGQRTRDVITEWTDALGANHREIQKYEELNGVLSPIGNTISTITNDTIRLREEQERLARANANVTTTTNKYNQTMRVGGEYVKATVTDTIQMVQGFESTKTTVTQFTNSMGELVTQTTTFNRVGDGWVRTGRVMTEVSKDTTEAVKQQGKATEDTAKKTKTFGDILKSSFTKMVSYYISSLPLRTFQKAISDATTTIKDFDKAITELGKVSDYNSKQLQDYAKSLGEIGEQVARTRTEMVEAVTEFVKSGYSEEDAAELARISALYQNTADEALSASDATAVLISQMKAYKDEFPTPESVIGITDAINKVSADFAVSSGDIGKGLTAAGAALSTYGNSFGETIAMLTAGENFLPVTD